MSARRIVPPPEIARWFEARFARGTRFYRVHLEQDLWGDWTLTRVHGRQNSSLGCSRTVWHGAREAAVGPLLSLIERRRCRHYVLIDFTLSEDLIMEPVQEVLNMLKRQAEIEGAMRAPGGIRITEERELLAIRDRLQKYPTATRASLEAALALGRPVEQISVGDVERFQGIRPHEAASQAA